MLVKYFNEKTVHLQVTIVITLVVYATRITRKM